MLSGSRPLDIIVYWSGCIATRLSVVGMGTSPACRSLPLTGKSGVSGGGVVVLLHAATASTAAAMTKSRRDLIRSLALLRRLGIVMRRRGRVGHDYVGWPWDFSTRWPACPSIGGRAS